MNPEDRASDIVLLVDEISRLLSEAKPVRFDLESAFADLREAVDMYEMAAIPSPARI